MTPVAHHRLARPVVAFSTVLLAFAMLIAPAPARAAEVVNDFAVLSVGFLGSPESQALIVAGQVADDVKLPAIVELGVPAGATIDWMGELSGGETTEADLAADYALNRTENGYDIYRATITKFRRFQIEAQIAPVFAADANGVMTASVKYVPINSAVMAIIGAEVPTGYTPANATGLSELGGGMNGTVWGKTINNQAANAEMAVTVSYSAAQAAPATGGGTSAGSNATMWMIVALIVTALFGVLIFFFTNRRMGTEYNNGK